MSAARQTKHSHARARDEIDARTRGARRHLSARSYPTHFFFGFLYYTDVDPHSKTEADAADGGVQEAIGNLKEKIAAKRAARMAKNVGVSSAEGFLILLRRKYQNIPRAWRQYLDADGSGELSKMESAPEAAAGHRGKASSYV